MASFISLDSIWRDRETYPSPSEYTIEVNQLNGWFRTARNVRAYPTDANLKPHEFVTSVKLHNLIVPFNVLTASFPILYLDFHSGHANDVDLIATLNGTHRRARFVASFEKIQNDGNNAPIWVHYRCNQEQVMRFKRDHRMEFRVTTRDGSLFPNFDTPVPEPPNPNAQIIANFENLPYIRDADFSHHNTEFTQV